MKRRFKLPVSSFQFVLTWLVLATTAGTAWAENFPALCADRTAIEQVYYNHRAGTKPPFEEILPRTTLENLVRLDQRKEAVLRKNYGIAITPALLDTEVQRINTTTRAPEMLAEIKSALGNDSSRFANAFAKPFLVERLLRERFENDDALHAPQRHECERIRAGLLTARTNGASAAELLARFKRTVTNDVKETTWQLTPRPTEAAKPSPDEIEIKQRFGPNAQLLSSPSAHGQDQKSYFEDMPGELQRVLRVQLQQPGDVSAVIETPSGFLLYLCQTRAPEALTAAHLVILKRDYDIWLDEHATAPLESKLNTDHESP